MINSSPKFIQNTNSEQILAIIDSGSISKHRKIHKSLLLLSKEEYRFLRALYEDDYQSLFPKEIKSVFQNKTGLALCLSNNPDLVIICKKFRQSVASQQEKEQISNLINKCNIIYFQIHQKLLAYQLNKSPHY
jgi:hypothetical protein